MNKPVVSWKKLSLYCTLLGLKIRVPLIQIIPTNPILIPSSKVLPTQILIIAIQFTHLLSMTALFNILQVLLG